MPQKNKLLVFLGLMALGAVLGIVCFFIGQSIFLNWAKKVKLDAMVKYSPTFQGYPTTKDCIDNKEFFLIEIPDQVKERKVMVALWHMGKEGVMPCTIEKGK